EAFIYLAVIFSPWAFGTTQSWSIWTMNVAGYFLGLLLAAKLGIRWLKGYRPPRWDQPPNLNLDRNLDLNRNLNLTPSRLTAALAVLTVAILGYCLISALNARATYHPREL